MLLPHGVQGGGVSSSEVFEVTRTGWPKAEAQDTGQGVHAKVEDNSLIMSTVYVRALLVKLSDISLYLSQNAVSKVGIVPKVLRISQGRGVHLE